MSTRYERMLEAISKGEKITDEPICRREMFLKALANKEGVSNLPEPICREEEFYRSIIKGEKITVEPICKKEEYLKAIANNEPLPESSGSSCREEKMFRKVCTSGNVGGGGGSTPTEPTTYSVTFGAGVKVLNGSTSITSGTKVASGTTLKVSYTLNANYHLVSFKVNGTEVANNSTITVTSNVTITFTQEIDTYAVTFNDGVSVLNGATSLTSGDQVPYGTSLKVSYTLSENYHLTAFKVNEVDATNNSTIMVTEDINIIFTQEINTYAITFGTGVAVMNGSTKLSSGDLVAHGTSLTISYSLTEHYHLTSFKVNGVDAQNNSTITITGATNIVFTQAIDTYSVTFGNGVSVLNGSTNVTSGEQVSYGTSLVVSYTLTDGYKLTSFQVNGVDTENNATITVTGNIEIVFAEEEEVVASTFSTMSAAEISAIGDEISANKMTSAQVEEAYGWKIGDTKDITLTTGEVIQMRIIGFNHDTLSDGSGTAGITLEMVNCLANKYKMNDGSTNAGGYPASLIKTTTLPAIKATLPQEWQNVIKMVDKKSANGGSTNYSETLTTSEDLFLLSEIEFVGTPTFSQNSASEGLQYEYWAGYEFTQGVKNLDRIKYRDGNGDGVPETAQHWWLRSCDASNTTGFVVCFNEGYCHYFGASFSMGVSFAFCVGGGSTGGSAGGDTPTFSTTFSENTPEQISAVSALISANNMTSAEVEATYGWKIGDTILYQLTTGENVEMRIVGFNHDDKADGSGKAGITLDMTHVLPTRVQMNSSASNSGGYPKSLAKTTLLPSFKALLPQEWQDAIKVVTKKSMSGGNYPQVVTSSEDLFFLSDIEIALYYSNTSSASSEGTTYEYWSDRNSDKRIKPYKYGGTSKQNWALRSCVNKSSNAFVCVTSSGVGNYVIADTQQCFTTFAFCI